MGHFNGLWLLDRGVEISVEYSCKHSGSRSWTFQYEFSTNELCLGLPRKKERKRILASCQPTIGAKISNGISLDYDVWGIL